jgi:cyclic pyranopterin phosphate synthase
MPTPLLDRLARPMTSLRVSVTDRCNLRCQYCMPEGEYTWLPRTDILHFEEIARLVRVFVRLGVDRVRLTGGEPLLRRDLPTLVRLLRQIDGLHDLSLTTNGVLLAEHAQALHDAGLQRVTVSLDTLRGETFERLTRRDELSRVREGIESAARIFPGFKIDTVLVRGVNDDEIDALVEEASRLGAEIRFIEYMDVGGATRWTLDQVVPREEILERLTSRAGVRPKPLPMERWAPADRFSLADGQVIGVISSTTAPFCRTCDRSRLTADGHWYLCLYAQQGHDLRAILRDGVTDDALAAVVRSTWQARADRGAEDRFATRDRARLLPLSALRRNPHLEMHTRGG